jgi:hypothetical protein
MNPGRDGGEMSITKGHDVEGFVNIGFGKFDSIGFASFYAGGVVYYSIMLAKTVGGKHSVWREP